MAALPSPGAAGSGAASASTAPGAPSPAPRWQVLRTDRWIDPAFDERLGREAAVALGVFAVQGDADAAWSALSQAHVYHVTAARDELPDAYFVRAPLLARCPQLLCVSSSGAGFDTVDVAACTAAGVAVVNQAGGNAVSVAEHTLGLMLGLSRRMVEGDRRLRREVGYPREAVMGHEIAGRTLGLVGIGHIGTRVATLAKAFGLTVLACDPLLAPDEIVRRGAEPVDFDTLLARADIVSLHCPRDASTMKLMNAAAFARMRRGSLFITTARGGIHDEAALLDALLSGHLAGAGLDVWDVEPPPLDHPLLALDNVFGTYHVGGVTHEARARMAAIAADQIAGFLAGERPPRLVNPEVWPRVQARRAAMLG